VFDIKVKRIAVHDEEKGRKHQQEAERALVADNLPEFLFDHRFDTFESSHDFIF